MKKKVINQREALKLMQERKNISLFSLNLMTNNRRIGKYLFYS